MQFHAEPGIILARRFGIAASLRLTQGCSWIWEIALGGVSAKVKLSTGRLVRPKGRWDVG